MEHNCEQLDCAFNEGMTCKLSLEGEEEKAWEDYGTKKCKKQVDWSMKHQSVVD